MTALSKIPNELSIKVLDFVGNPHTTAPVSRGFQEQTRASWVCNGLFVKMHFPHISFNASEADPIEAVYEKMKQRIEKCGLLVPQEFENSLTTRKVAQFSQAIDRVMFFMQVADHSELAKTAERGDSERDVLKRSDSVFQWMTTHQQHLGEIEGLCVAGFDLISVPEEIGFFVRLQTLKMQANKLTRVPSCIAQFPLTSLDLSGNRLRKLPHEIGQLGQLQELFVQNNQLKSLPEEITQLMHLRTFYAWGNPGLILTGQMTTFLSDLDHVFLDFSIPRPRLDPLRALGEAQIEAVNVRELDGISYRLSQNFAGFSQGLFAQSIDQLELLKQLTSMKSSVEEFRFEREEANKATADKIEKIRLETEAERVRNQAAASEHAEWLRNISEQSKSTSAKVHETLARADEILRKPTLRLDPVQQIRTSENEKILRESEAERVQNQAAASERAEQLRIMNHASPQSRPFRGGSRRDSDRLPSLVYEESPSFRKEFFNEKSKSIVAREHEALALSRTTLHGPSLSIEPTSSATDAALDLSRTAVAKANEAFALSRTTVERADEALAVTRTTLRVPSLSIEPTGSEIDNVLPPEKSVTAIAQSAASEPLAAQEAESPEIIDQAQASAPAGPASLWQQAQAFFAQLFERFVAWLQSVQDWLGEAEEAR